MSNKKESKKNTKLLTLNLRRLVEDLNTAGMAKISNIDLDLLRRIYKRWGRSFEKGISKDKLEERIKFDSEAINLSFARWVMAMRKVGWLEGDFDLEAKRHPLVRYERLSDYSFKDGLVNLLWVEKEGMKMADLEWEWCEIANGGYLKGVKGGASKSDVKDNKKKKKAVKKKKAKSVKKAKSSKKGVKGSGKKGSGKKGGKK